MKTREAFYEEICGSKTLQDELETIRDGDALERFLKEHGCDASPEAFLEYVRSLNEGEICDDDAADAAGGIYSRPAPSPFRNKIEIL